MADVLIQDVIDEFEKKPRKLVDQCNIDTNSRKYWQDVFHAMDEYSAVPYHKRESVLEKTLEDDELVSLLRGIYDIHKHDDIIDFKNILNPNARKTEVVEHKPKAIFQEYEDLRKAESYSKLGIARRIQSFISEKAPPQLKMTRPSVVDYRKELTMPGKDDNNPFGDSMYTTFLKKSPDEASRWRPKPPVTLDGMSLAAKCDAITREIATTFVDWMESLGGESKTILNVELIEGLFEIGFNCHAADSLKIRVHELNSVTEYIAHARQTPELSFATQLYRQLYRDKTAVRSREANFAFGTMLPPEMRTGTSEDSDVSKWLENKRVPENLATMAVVWEDIETLKSTEGYCNWMQEHAHIVPPSYLVNKGMLENRKKLADPSIMVTVNSNSQQSQSKVSFANSSIITV